MKDIAQFDVDHNDELNVAIVRLAIVEYIEYLEELTTLDAQNNNIRLGMLDLFRRWYAFPMVVDELDEQALDAPSPYDTCVICFEPMSSHAEWMVRCIDDQCRNWLHLECATQLRVDRCPTCSIPWPANWRENNAPTIRRTGPVANRPLIGGRRSGTWHRSPSTRRRTHHSANTRRRMSPRRDR